MYQSRVTRKNPTAIIILIDQSGSMAEKTVYAGVEMPKADAVASIVNSLLSELINRSRREEGVRDYFDIAIYGYSGNKVSSMLPYPKDIIPLSKLSDKVLRNEEYKIERRMPDGSGSISVLTKKIWIEPAAGGNTPMLAAFDKALSVTSDWCSKASHRNSYPPTIFNITDGESTDGSPQELITLADKIKQLSTDDGNALLVNVHLSSHFGETPVIFPASLNDLPHDRYAGLLYRMSSPLPEAYLNIIGLDSSGSFRAMGYNASMNDLINIMNIGSISINTID